MTLGDGASTQPIAKADTWKLLHSIERERVGMHAQGGTGSCRQDWMQREGVEGVEGAQRRRGQTDQRQVIAGGQAYSERYSSGPGDPKR